MCFSLLIDFHLIFLQGKDQVAFMSEYSIHQLHIFVFVLAIFHILQCIMTLTLGRTKVRTLSLLSLSLSALIIYFNSLPLKGPPIWEFVISQELWSVYFLSLRTKSLERESINIIDDMIYNKKKKKYLLYEHNL